MKNPLGLAGIILILMIGCQKRNPGLQDKKLLQKATHLAQQWILIDTHIDVPYRLFKKMEDISVRTEGGNFDYPRAKAGGLNVPFMAIYVSAEYQKKGGAREMADSLIELVYSFQEKWPEKFTIVRSPAEVRERSRRGKICLAMGMENGAPIEGDFHNLQHFYDRGIRYITLTHSKNNHICDSSYEKKRRWNGLSPFGKRLIPEMNRLGLMIDVSHVSDSTFYQVIRLSKAPVIASHSSCRSFTPGWERNMSDEMIRLLAEKGGVIQINFGSAFLREDIQKKSQQAWDHIDQYLETHHLKEGDKEAEKYIQNYMKEHPPGYADVEDVVAHIDHGVHLVGVEHVGIGSDFDGLGDSLPTGLKDVSYYPNLIYHLLKKGYSEEDIKKICGENLLRVWEEVEKTAQRLQTG